MTRFSLEFFRAHVVHGEVQLIKSWTYRSDSSLVLVINHQLLFHKTMLITEITVITVIFRSSDRASGQSTFLWSNFKLKNFIQKSFSTNNNLNVINLTFWLSVDSNECRQPYYISPSLGCHKHPF